MTAGSLTDDELALLRSVLDLARQGRTDELLAAVRAGVPVNLTGASGDSLLILAAYHDHPAVPAAMCCQRRSGSFSRHASTN